MKVLNVTQLQHLAATLSLHERTRGAVLMHVCLSVCQITRVPTGAHSGCVSVSQ